MDQPAQPPRRIVDSVLFANATPMSHLFLFVWLWPVIMMLMFSGTGAGFGSLGFILAPVSLGALKNLSDRFDSAPARRVVLGAGALDVVASALLMWNLPRWSGFLACLLVSAAATRTLRRPDRDRPDLDVLEAMIWRAGLGAGTETGTGTGMRAPEPGGEVS